MTALIQDIFCDGTQARIPVQPFFSYKSTYHQTYAGRVHVDFSLHVVDKPSLNLGIWRCRINFWLNDNEDPIGLEYYMTGFRRALAEAEKFVHTKYGLQQILAPQSDEQLTEKFKTREATRIARQKEGVVRITARKEPGTN